MSTEDQDYWKNLVNNAMPEERSDRLKTIKEKADNQLHQAMVRNPAKSQKKMKAIDYISLDDSSYIILSYWSRFQEIFKEKATFNREIGDLRILRNLSAHNNDLTMRERERGHAAILYFEGILKKGY
jgi:hypothetical protein